VYHGQIFEKNKKARVRYSSSHISYFLDRYKKVKKSFSVENQKMNNFLPVKKIDFMLRLRSGILLKI
jgi:hypothetical protein